MQKFIVVKLPLIKSDSFFYADFDKVSFQKENNIRLTSDISTSVQANELVMLFTGENGTEKEQSILDGIS